MGQKSNDLHTANTMVTNDDVFIHVAKHGQPLGNAPHWHQFAAFNMADFEFPGFPDINQTGTVCLEVVGKLAGIEPLDHSCFCRLKVGNIGFKQAFANPFIMADPGNQHRLLGRGFTGYGEQATIDGQCILKVLRYIF